MSELVVKQVEVTKEANEVASAMVKIVAESKKALVDGWQTGTDLPAILGATMADMLIAIDGVNKLGAELDANPKEFFAAFSLMAGDIYAELKKNDEVSEPV